MISSRFGLIATLLLLFSWQVSAVEIISHPGVKETSLPLSSLRSIFSMRLTQWPDGTQIRVFVLRDKAPLHAEFSKKMLGVFPHQLRRAWNRQIFSGTGQAPITIDTEADMRSQVTSTPGAIGYLPEEQVNEQVRTIEIE